MTNRIGDAYRSHDLKHEGVVDQGQYGMAPYVTYNGLTSYSHRPSVALRGIDGLTAGGWFRTLASGFLMGVWVESLDRCWKLGTNVNNQPVFSVSNDGSLSFSVTGSIIPDATWTHIVGRYTPSTDISIFINGAKTSFTSPSVPTQLYTTAAEFMVGGNGSEFLNGRASMAFMSALPLADNYISLIYQLSRKTFNV